MTFKILQIKIQILYADILLLYLCSYCPSLSQILIFLLHHSPFSTLPRLLSEIIHGPGPVMNLLKNMDACYVGNDDGFFSLDSGIY